MYSISFRESVLRVYEYFGSMRKTATILKVSIASISRWAKNINPLKHQRRPIKVTDAMISLVKLLINKNPSICCKEIVEEIKNAFEVEISKQLVHLIIQRLGFSYKRIRKRGKSNKKIDLINELKDKYKTLPNNTLIISIDESGFDNRPLPIYGYALKGQQASTDRKHYTLLMAVFNNGFKQYKILETSVNSAIFYEFIKDLNLQKGTTILLDNASIHKSKNLKELVESKSCNLMFTPPYTPEFNPIEMSFGTIKNKFYKMRYSKNDCFKKSINSCVEQIHEEAIINTFKHVEKLILR